ncbi:hypothetical protein CHS0354_016060 [Potamilus streckersoni]|uniref:Chitin-binding type-2 domain-containing protein n=1 Tax=Potamilus streckersoni TaxID=2493646 RepID=A0AAE0T0U2_9BIVA|nr:hypothetical protein CHS0354_016060 [Potamilus streckersoni]
MSQFTRNFRLVLLVCAVFVSMPHGTVSSGCSQSSVCGVDCGWSAWNGWTSEGACSVTCGGGSQAQIRNRTCINLIPQKSVQQCSGTSTECISILCNNRTCTIDGSWSAWNNWISDGDCVITCSGCTQPQTRLRTCTNPIPQNGGKPCNGTSRESQIIECDATTCPLVDGGWGAWYAWTYSSSCSASCGGGTRRQVRARSCSNPFPQNGGKQCNGSISESQTVQCNTQPCSPVDGIWSNWNAWTSKGSWNVTCTMGKQTQTRTRSCSNSQNCGRTCDGNSMESQIVQCNKQTCPPECTSAGNITNCSISSTAITRTVLTPGSGGSGCNSLNCICDETYHGYIRYPTNCTQFIMCAWNKPFLSSCENGTYWNQNLQICDQGRC